ncbi:MAG: helix-turn-helix transcriptional regulator [Tenericutes bacterium]|nr:helix-turn-helix transcriptional regulator [Mycoplasmatota bacterium]
MTFGERIRANRIKNNMSQKQLAELLNVTPQTISKWENDLSEPGFQMITEMTNVFHISHDELFIGETEVLYQGSIYIAKKDLRMKKYYDFFVGLLIFLSVAMIITTTYISTLEILTWHFTLGFGLFTMFWLFLLFMTSRWRYIYLDSPNDLLDIYHDKVVIQKGNLTVEGIKIKNIYIKKYQFYSGIRVYENNGFLKILTTDNQMLVVRDIIDIEDLKKVIYKMKIQFIEEETK